jgi:syntaxin 1B/2/3
VEVTFVKAASVQDSIGTFSANVQRISELNTRSLDALGNDGAAVKQELDALVAQTMSLSAQLKDRLKQLQDAVLPGARGRQEKEMRQNRVCRDHWLGNVLMRFLGHTRSD